MNVDANNYQNGLPSVQVLPLAAEALQKQTAQNAVVPNLTTNGELRSMFNVAHQSESIYH
jgi:hypothetical protein